MTNQTDTTAHPGKPLADDDTTSVDDPLRARAELLALLRDPVRAPERHPYPAPRFFPASAYADRPHRPAPPYVADHRPTPPYGADHGQTRDWLRPAARLPAETPEAHAPAEPLRRPRPPQRRRRKASRGMNRFWLAATVFIAVSSIGGIGMFYVGLAGYDLPGSRQMARIGSGLRALYPTPAPATTTGAKRSLATATMPASVLAPVDGQKPVNTAHLDVADASGVIMDQIPLRLAVADAAPGRDIVIALAGLPDTASLSAGTRRADGQWLIDANEVSGLKLMMTTPTPAPLTLAVTARDRASDELVAPMRQMTLTVAPTAPRLATTVRADQPDAKGAAVLAQGLEAMLAGDVTSARSLFRQAIELGERRAVAHLGRTFDPAVLARFKLDASAANRERAMAWYRRAIEAGDNTVKTDMVALEKWPAAKQ